MKILILSFYYQPDLCAGSFRCTALVEQLHKLVSNGVLTKDTRISDNKFKHCSIDVITTAPNRYASFNAEAPSMESESKLAIRRIMLPSHCNGMLDQAKAFAYFANKVNQLVKHTDYSLVFATSSRLMTAVLGAFIARKKKAKLYLDIRDIFVDTLTDILPAKFSIGTKPLFSLLEKWAFKRAQRINLISKGFEEHFTKRYPQAKFSWFTNGIDSEFISIKNKMVITSHSSPTKPLTVLYAGNIGEGQGLHIIIPALAKRMEGRIIFKLIGDGGRKVKLKEKLISINCNNVELLPPVNRKILIQEYQKADILFLHLNDYAAFRKVLPSKLFEYAAMGKPIWAGVAGFAATFIKTEISNAAIFYPGNVTEAEQCFNYLNLINIRRNDFIKKYKRRTIMHSMAADILSLLP